MEYEKDLKATETFALPNSIQDLLVTNTINIHLNNFKFNLSGRFRERWL